MTRRRRLAAWIGVPLLLLYAVPLFFPPPASYPLAPAGDADLWARVFPGVPSWWVLSRLLCLFVGAVVVATSLGLPLPLRFAARRSGVTEEHNRASRMLQWVALLVALIHALSGLYVMQFNRLAETIYFVGLALPTALLILPELRPVARRVRGALPQLILLTIVPLLWLAVSIPTAWRSPRAANLVDMWMMAENLDAVVSGQKRILTDEATPGHSNAYMMMEGVSFLGPDKLPLTYAQLQVSHLFWAALCGFAVGLIAWRMVAPEAALVAQAVFLFSQFVFSAAYVPGMLMIGPMLPIALLLPILAVRETGSAAAVAAFGAVVGFSSTEPLALLTAGLLSGVMIYSLSQLPKLPWFGIGAGLLSGTAAALPALPGYDTLVAMAHRYTLGKAQLAGMIEALFGQRTPRDMMALMQAGNPGAADLPVGALLTPFAIMRTPHRLWGDVLLDPLGIVVLTIGLLLCVRHAWRHRTALLVLGLIAAGLLQGFTATGDAVSHNRISPALMPLAVCAAVALEAIRRAYGWRARVVAPIAALLIALSGSVMFLKITPSILPGSWLATSLEALGTSKPNAEAVFLGYEVRAFYVGYITRLLPARPLDSRLYTGLEGNEVVRVSRDRVYFWSPSMERDAVMSRTICRRFPGAAQYVLWDEGGVFRAYAASPAGATWTPQLPIHRWAVSFCEAGSSTGGSAAAMSPAVGEL